MRATTKRSKSDSQIGVPYASIGFTDAGRVTAECPVCGLLFEGGTSTAATRCFAKHYISVHEHAAKS